MADKKEYIERDSIYRRVKTHTNPYGKPTLDYESGVKVLDMIKQEPAADVVEVVRCKDCIHSVQLLDRLMCKRTAHKSENGWFGLRATADKHFCSYGERKEQT